MTDIKSPYLVINTLSQDQYDSIVNPSDTELYLTPDDTDDKLALKQDKLSSVNAGDGISITDNSVINAKVSENMEIDTLGNIETNNIIWRKW